MVYFWALSSMLRSSYYEGRMAQYLFNRCCCSSKRYSRRGCLHSLVTKLVTND